MKVPITDDYTNKKAVLSQRWPCDAPYSLYGCSENFWKSWLRPQI